jgi:hypothetical protein
MPDVAMTINLAFFGLAAPHPVPTATAAPTTSGAHRDTCACGVAMEGRRGPVYNEEAFRYLLAIEQKRSQRADRPLFLLLVDPDGHLGMSASFDTLVARQLFAGLCHCLRETDFVGWYREGRVAGAVVTASQRESGTDVPRLVVQRVTRMLGAIFAPDIARRLCVRIYRDPPPEKPEAVIHDDHVANNRGIQCSSSA